MNRGEYEAVLEKIMYRLTEPNGNFQKLFPDEDDQSLKKMAAIALMAVDEFYVHLSEISRFTDPEDCVQND